MSQTAPDRPFAFVFWDDPHSLPSTEVVNEKDVSALHGAVKIVTAGWILKQDETGISLAGEYCGDGDYRNTTYIMMRLVTDIVPLKITKKRTRKVAHVNDTV